MSADEGGGARSVDGHARSFQVQGVGEAVRRDGVGCSRCAVRAGEVEAASGAHAHPVVLVDAHKVSDVRGLALQAPLVPAALEEGHVGHLHDLALARVHALGLSRRDLEELAVKEVNTLNAEATVPRVGAAKLRVGVPVHTVVPAHEGDISEAVAASLAYAVPELELAVGTCAVTAVHRVDSDLLAGRRGRAGAQQAQHLRVALHRAKDLVHRGLGHVEAGEGQ
mmetsp:Transcript_23684/g.64439  ORF Transcript_23684/g.64439 Transcript_23684/m.64439 type:complete len:224 (+) Transcript_23684:1440-2111(+)